MKFKEMISSEKLVLVDFFATWCGPCKALMPVLTQVKSEIKDVVKIYKIDVDKNPNIAAQYQIQGVPTLILFKNGEKVWRQSGVVPSSQIVKIIKDNNN